MIWTVLLVVLGLVVLGLLADRGLRRMERRGWIYYRTKDHPRRGDLGLITSIYQPSIEYMIEEEASVRSRGVVDARGQGDDEDE